MRHTFFIGKSYAPSLVNRFSWLNKSGEVLVSSENKCSLLAMLIEAERARSRELLSKVIWEFDTKWNLWSFWFFRYGLLNKKYLFLIKWSISEMNRPGPTRPTYDVLWRIFSLSAQKIITWNFNINLLPTSKFSYTILKQKFCIGFETLAFFVKPDFRRYFMHFNI